MTSMYIFICLLMQFIHIKLALGGIRGESASKTKQRLTVADEPISLDGLKRVKGYKKARNESIIWKEVSTRVRSKPDYSRSENVVYEACGDELE